MIDEADRELILAVQAGDTEAFGDIVEAHQEAIRAFVAMLGVDPMDVDEVAQQTFVEAYRCLDRFDGKRPLIPWLRGIANNMALRYFSSRRRKQLVSLDKVLGELCQQELDEDAELSRDGYMKALRHCLEALPGRAQALMKARYWDGKKTTEMADEQGCTVTSLRVRLSRLRQSLRNCIEKAAG